MRPKLNQIADPVTHVPNHHCSAYGCQMAGLWTTSTTGSEQWWCLFHANVDPSFNSHVTQEVNANMRIIRAAYALMEVPYSSRSTEAVAAFGKTMTKIGRPEFAAQSDKEAQSPKLLGYRVLQNLAREVTSTKRAKDDEPEVYRDEQMSKLSGLLHGLLR